MSTRGETTYLQVRDMILDGALSKGDAIQELALSKRLNVSRTPVREAISRLVAEGLLSREPGQVPRVRESSVDDLIEILHIRRILEIESAGLAAARPDHATIDRLMESIETLLNDPSPKASEHAELDEDIHTSIARMSGSKLMVSMVRDLKLKTRFLGLKRIPERFQPGCQEHLALLEVIGEGDVALSQKVMRQHLDGVRQSIIAHLQRLF